MRQLTILPAAQALLAIVLCGGWQLSGMAQEPVPYAPSAAPSPDELQELRERLHETESRLRSLERRREVRRLPAVGRVGARLEAPGEAPSEAAELQERIEALEQDREQRIKDDKKKEEKKKADDEKKKAEDEKKKLAEAIKKAEDAKKPTQKWTGRIHTPYWAFPQTSPGANAFETGSATNDVDDRFLFRRVRFGLQGDIPDLMLYKAEFDINRPDTPQFKDCFIGFKELPLLHTVLLGNQKRPYGLDHINSSRYNVFIERPFIIEAVNPDARRYGICSYGKSDDEAYNWRFGAYMMEDMQQIGIVTANSAYQAEVCGRFANTIWYDECSGGRGFAHWAVSGTLADPSDSNPNSAARFSTRPEARTTGRWIDTGIIAGTQQYEMLGVEALVNLGPFQVVGEYQHIWLQRRTGRELHFHGAYCYVSYFLTGESMAWERSTGQLDRVHPYENFWIVDTCCDGVRAGWGAWQVAARLSAADFSDDNVRGGVGQSVTLGVNWHWNPYARMMFNCIHGQIDDHAPVNGQTSGTYTILGTQFMVDY